MLRIFVAVATVGRPKLAQETIDLLADQTRPPDGILAVTTGSAEAEIIGMARARPEVAVAKQGSCRQRNHALDLLSGRADVVVFFDDDFVPEPHYLEEVEQLFETYPDVVGITGELIADGIHNAGFSVDEAKAAIVRAAGTAKRVIKTRQALYGCNMAIRTAAAEGVRFDETLPLYGWLEDVDFTSRLAVRGRLISTPSVTGVHLGVKNGRTPGKKFGYSQVANVIYLNRKDTMQPHLGMKLLRQNVLSNIVKSIRPEPWIDRRGRLLGNMIAFADLLRGRIDPRRIETL